MYFPITDYIFKKEFVDTRENIVIKLIEKYGELVLQNTKLQRSPYLTIDNILKYFSTTCKVSITFNNNVNQEFIDEHRILSDYYCSVIQLNEDNILKYASLSVLTYTNPTFTKSFIDTYIGDKFRHWSHLSANPNLDKEFIERYKDKLYWFILSKNKCLTLPLIYTFIDKINWTFVSANPNLDENFIITYIERLSIESLCSNPAFTMNLVERFKDRVSWTYLSFNPSLTIEYIDKYIDKFNGCSQYLISNPNLNKVELFEKYIDIVDWQYIHYNRFLYDDTVFNREITKDIESRRKEVLDKVYITEDIKTYILSFYLGYN